MTNSYNQTIQSNYTTLRSDCYQRQQTSKPSSEIGGGEKSTRDKQQTWFIKAHERIPAPAEMEAAAAADRCNFRFAIPKPSVMNLLRNPQRLQRTGSCPSTWNAFCERDLGGRDTEVCRGVISSVRASSTTRWTDKRKHRSPLTWIVQVYSESSSSLTVQLHSRSRLLTLLLIRRLSIFPMRLCVCVCACVYVCVCVCVDREEEREAPCTHARTTLMSGHINDLCGLGSNTRSETGLTATVRSTSASSLAGRLASFWRGDEIMLLLLRSLSFCLSPSHPVTPLTTPSPPRRLAVAMPLQCRWAGGGSWMASLPANCARSEVIPSRRSRLQLTFR